MLLVDWTILIYGCSPIPSIVRLRNPGFPHRGFFVSAPLAGYYHIGIAAPAAGADEPLSPLGNGVSGRIVAPFRWDRVQLDGGIPDTLL